MNEKLCLFVYTDASFGNLNDRESQGSYLIFLVGNDYNCNLLSWQSKRLKGIPRSSLVAETIAVLEDIDVAIFIREIFQELTHHRLPLTVFTDNKSLYDAVKLSKYVQNKRLQIDTAAVKESINHSEVKNIESINTKRLADTLTKSGANTNFLLKTLSKGKISVTD